MALRDILQRRKTSVANGGIAEVDGRPSVAEGDANDPGPGADISATSVRLPGRSRARSSKRAKTLRRACGSDARNSHHREPVHKPARQDALVYCRKVVSLRGEKMTTRSSTRRRDVIALLGGAVASVVWPLPPGCHWDKTHKLSVSVAMAPIGVAAQQTTGRIPRIGYLTLAPISGKPSPERAARER
jgi:hypothetical protein